MQQRAAQLQMEQLQQAILRQKDDALREMEQQRKNRERREQLRKEHDSSAPQRAQKRLILPAAPITRPVQKRKIENREGRPFEAENATDEHVLNEYTSRSPPNPSLPAVPFIKRNDTYWLGQRRCNAVVESGIVVVKLGSDREHFSSWIEQAERVEAIRIKGLMSARTIITLHQAVGSHSRVTVKT